MVGWTSRQWMGSEGRKGGRKGRKEGRKEERRGGEETEGRTLRIDTRERAQVAYFVAVVWCGKDCAAHAYWESE